MTGCALRGTASASTDSMMALKSKLTLWQETLNSTAAMSPAGTASLILSISVTNSSAEKPPTEMIVFCPRVRG